MVVSLTFPSKGKKGTLVDLYGINKGALERPTRLRRGPNMNNLWLCPYDANYQHMKLIFGRSRILRVLGKNN